MTRSFTITLSLLFLTAFGAMAQCAYTIMGQVTNANNQIVNNQAVVVSSNAGLDTVFTNPNGVYYYTLVGTCDSTMTFVLQTSGCGMTNSVTVNVALNQTMNVPLTVCTNSSSCSTSVQVSNTTGYSIQFNSAGTALGGATIQSVVWDFGNGYSTNNYPNGGTYTYTTPGTYQVCATTSWSNGCTSTDCETITIGSGGCAYIVSGYVTNGSNSSVVAGNQVTVTLPAAQGGGSYSAVTSNTGYYIITVPGPCNSLFTGTISTMGCGAVNQQTINFTPNITNYTQDLFICSQPIDSCHSTVTAIVSGNTVQFAWSGSSTNGATAQSVMWSFGNGTSSNNYPNGGSYTYTTPGTYSICATVVWSNGCTSSSCYAVTIGSNTQQSICGCVQYQSNGVTLLGGCGTAYLLQFDSASNSMLIVDSTNITPNGYCFHGNYSGAYTIWAQPCASLSVSAGVLPTYLGNVLSWQNAATALYGMNNYQANCIMLATGQNSQGPAQIGGTILWGNDKAPGDPVAGINVFLYDNNGDVFTATITDSEGYYSFANLPYGTYQLYPEFPGYVTHPLYVTVSPENPTVEADNFYLGFGVFSTAAVEESIIHIGGLFPNPAQEAAVLSITSKEAGTGKMYIVDITGKTVSSANVNLVKGKQDISLDLDNIASGVYTVTLSLNGQQLHTKLIKR